MYTMYSMTDTFHFSATEARQNFFELLRLAQKGNIVTIEKKNENITFELQQAKKPRKDLAKLAKEMGKIGLKVVSLNEMQRILEESHTIELE